MSRTACTVAAVLTLVLAAPQPATAQRAHAGTTHRLQLLGDHIWGPSTRCPTITTSYANPDQYGVPGADAWADPGNCRIWIDQAWLREPGPFLCQLWLHERGHIAGYYNPDGVRQPDGSIDHQHSPRRASIMYPDAPGLLDGWVGRPGHRHHVYNVDRRCQHFFRGWRPIPHYQPSQIKGSAAWSVSSKYAVSVSP